MYVPFLSRGARDAEEAMSSAGSKLGSSCTVLLDIHSGIALEEVCMRKN